MSIKTDMAEFGRELDARNALIQQFRDTSQNDFVRRDQICRELEPYFERRADWQRRHFASYTWATARKVIKPLNVKGYNHGKPVPPRDKPMVLKKSEARDQLHFYSKRNNCTIAQEIQAGELFRKQLELGRTIDAALKCAIDFLSAKDTGMAA